MESLVAWEIVDASLFLAVLGLTAIGFARAIYICQRVAKDYKKEGDEEALELVQIGPTNESTRCLIDNQPSPYLILLPSPSTSTSTYCPPVYRSNALDWEWDGRPGVGCYSRGPHFFGKRRWKKWKLIRGGITTNWKAIAFLLHLYLLQVFTAPAIALDVQ